MGSLTDKRKRYYTMIWTYQQRRLNFKLRYGLKSDKFKKRAAILDKKIKVWKQQIRRIDVTNNKIQSIERAVFHFTGESIIGKVYTPKRKANEFIRLSKFLYYKFGLENRVRGMELREHIGVPKTMFNQPYAYRKEFTRSFSSNPENRQTWLKFKRFYESSTTASKKKDNRTYAL